MANHYITDQDQKKIAELILEYKSLYHNPNPENDRRFQIICNILYSRYLDKIINGVIFSGFFKLWQYADLDDLQQEAREAIHLSIIKDQWQEEKGKAFTFFSTVVARNLMNFTKKQTKHNNFRSDTDISVLYNNNSLIYCQDFDKEFVIDDLQNILINFFEGKPKFQELSILLIDYFKMNFSRKFVKKHFIEYTKAYGYSPALVSIFFNNIKKCGFKQETKDFLHLNKDADNNG